MLGCPANEATTDEATLTPQKIAKAEGYKDAMKELKKLTTFQDKAARGARPKGFSDQWAVRVRPSSLMHLYCCRSLPYFQLAVLVMVANMSFPKDHVTCRQASTLDSGFVEFLIFRG